MKPILTVLALILLVSAAGSADSRANEPEKITVADVLKGLSLDETKAMFCHELAHWKFCHGFASILLTVLPSGLFVFGAFRKFVLSPAISNELGINLDYDHVFLPFLWSYFFSVFFRLVSFLRGRTIAHSEFQADSFAALGGFGETVFRRR